MASRRAALRFSLAALLVLPAMACDGGGAGGAGSSCSTDNDCKNGLLCVVGICTGLPNGCSTDGDCPGGVCLDGACTGGRGGCMSDGDCDPGWSCGPLGVCVQDGPACTVDGDCDDQDPGTDDACQGGACVHVPVPTGCENDGDCLDGDPCTTDTCVEGDCQYGAVAGCCNIDGDCDDGLDTTLDACEDNACTHEPVPIPCSGDGECDDGDVCTFDGCVDGICQNTPSADPFCCNDVDDCDDGDDSTVDHCIDSQCSWTNCVSDIDCEDNNPCSGQSCQAGVCVFTVVESADCACITNADCVGKGGACSLVNTGPTSVATYCVNVAGPKMGGVECEENGDCYTGLCMGLSSGEDLCFQGCEADNECAPGMMCATIVWGMGTANEKEIPACLPAPAFCTGDGSCPEGEICRPTENPNQPDTILLVCAAPASGTKTAGAVCAADADCQSNICVQVIGKGQSICWSPCVATTDCAPGLTCYPNLLYFLFDQETEGTADDVQYSVGSCMPNLGSYAPCQGDTGCPAGEFCYPGNNQTATALEPRCLKSWGGSNPAGQTCNTDGQCLSSACISAPNGFCLGLCTSSAGCYGGTTCQNYPTFVVDDKGTPDDDTDDVLDDVDLCLP